MCEILSTSPLVVSCHLGFALVQIFFVIIQSVLKRYIVEQHFSFFKFGGVPGRMASISQGTQWHSRSARSLLSGLLYFQCNYLSPIFWEEQL